MQCILQNLTEAPHTEKQGRKEVRMGVLNIIGWALFSAAAASWMILRKARAELTLAIAEANEEVAHWRAEAMRARTRASQLKCEIDAWKAGHAQGQSDLINAIPMLTATALESVTDDPAASSRQAIA
jgi:hypothetical protein